MKKLFLAVMLMVIGVLVACNKAAEPTAVPPVELTIVATDIAYDTQQFEVKAGQPVRLTLQNDGVLEHDFSIMEMPHSGEVMPVGMVMEGENMEHDMSNMTADPEIHVAAPQDMNNTIEFTPSEPGEYEFFCTVSGHKEAGMVGTLVVTAP